MWSLVVALAAPPVVHLEPLWQVPRVQQDRAAGIRAAEHPNVVSVGDALIYVDWSEQAVRPGDADPVPTTIAVDVQGHPLWRRPGHLQAADDTVIVVRDGEVWRGLVPATGAERWTWAPAWDPLPLSEAEAPATWLTDSAGDLLAYDSGTYTRHALIDRATGRTRWQGVGSLQAVGHDHFLRRDGGGLVGIERATGAERWRWTPRVDQLGIAGDVVWLASGPAGQQRLQALDGRTGAPRAAYLVDQHLVLTSDPEWPVSLTPPLDGSGPHDVQLDPQTRQLGVEGNRATQLRFDLSTGAVVAWRPAVYTTAYEQTLRDAGLWDAFERLVPEAWPHFAAQPPGLDLIDLGTTLVAVARRTEAPPAHPVVVKGRIEGHCVRPLLTQKGKKNRAVCSGLRVRIGERTARVDRQCRFVLRGVVQGLPRIEVLGVPGVPAEERWGAEPTDGRCVTPKVVPGYFGVTGPGEHTLDLKVVETASVADDPG